MSPIVTELQQENARLQSALTESNMLVLIHRQQLDGCLKHSQSQQRQLLKLQEQCDIRAMNDELYQLRIYQLECLLALKGSTASASDLLSTPAESGALPTVQAVCPHAGPPAPSQQSLSAADAEWERLQSDEAEVDASVCQTAVAALTVTANPEEQAASKSSNKVSSGSADVVQCKLEESTCVSTGSIRLRFNFGRLC